MRSKDVKEACHVDLGATGVKVLRWECLEGSKGSRDPGVVSVG